MSKELSNTKNINKMNNLNLNGVSKVIKNYQNTIVRYLKGETFPSSQEELKNKLDTISGVLFTLGLTEAENFAIIDAARIEAGLEPKYLDKY